MNKLIAARDAELSAAQAIMDACATENRSPTDEDKAQLDAHLSKVESINATIKQNERLEALKKASPGLENTGGAKVHERAEDKPFGSFGEFLLSVKGASEPGVSHHDMDPRLRKHDLRNKEVRAASGMNETVGSEGGFLVQQETSTTLLEKATAAAVLWPRTDRQPVGPNSNGIKLPFVDETSRANGSRWGGVRAYWLDEADEKTASKPKLGRLELNLRKLVGLCYTTDELNEDAVALESFIDRAFTEEFSFALDDAVIRGTGTGMPLGILNSNAKIAVAKETSQVAATINFQNLAKMWARLATRSRANAVWLVNADISTQLMGLTFQVKNVAGTENVAGVPIYLPPGGISGSPFGTIFGRPVIDIEQAETLGTEGDIILADLSQYMRIEKEMKKASSMHVRFIYDETCFRFVQRVDGQPTWKQPLTPYKGTATRSPFITLQTRS